MKKILLTSFIAFMCLNIFAQCDELIISEYVEGSGNNKAIEIYNPTNSAINLSGYALARFSNGSTTAPSDSKVIQLPADMIQPYDVYVVVIDKTDMSLWCSTFDKPVWNGYNVIDTLFVYDPEAGMETDEPVTDSDGNICYGPQYNDEGCPLFGDIYTEEYDLQCKADAFLCPIYDVNNVMYFNGNDAVALITGTEILGDGSNILDVIGVIGEDPPNGAWVNEDGYDMTRNRTLVRDASVTTGNNELGDIIFQAGGTFQLDEWHSNYNNAFQFLGIHKSDCYTENQDMAVNCAGEPVPPYTNCAGEVVSAKEVIAPVAFNMFPNPNASGLLNIAAAEAIQGVRISNMLGQQVLSSTVSNETNTEVNISKLNKGMFIVNILFDNNRISTSKLVVE